MDSEPVDSEPAFNLPAFYLPTNKILVLVLGPVPSLSSMLSGTLDLKFAYKNVYKIINEFKIINENGLINDGDILTFAGSCRFAA